VAVRLSIRHLTAYHYPQPAWDSFNKIRLEPADTDRQTLLSFELRVLPEAVLRRHHDYFGTVVHHFHAYEEHALLSIEARSVVMVSPTPEPAPMHFSVLERLRSRFFEFLEPTTSVPLRPNWSQILNFPSFSRKVYDGDAVHYLDALTLHLKQFFSYTPGATDLATPLLDFAQSRRGVCQDYAHAMLALCRFSGIPARYVSGYIYAGDNYVGAEASHAWVECFLAGSGWIGFDPTNGVRAGLLHVKLGHGRDYHDVPPARGLRRGGGQEDLQVVVEVTVLDGV
jgi:transglutaminase-like putative cysteine protease